MVPLCGENKKTRKWKGNGSKSRRDARGASCKGREKRPVV
jgi:hypothetical protein